MKKISLLIFLLVTSLVTFSQSYVRVNVGYGIPLNSQIVGVEENFKYDSDTDEDTESYEAIYGSFGSGISFNVAFGKAFGESALGFDLEAGYVIGKKYDIKSTDDFDGDVDKVTETNFARSFQFCPSLTFTANVGKFKPYTRIGPVIAVTKITNEINVNDGDAKLAFEYSGGIAIGLKGAFGLCFNPDSKMQFFTEINFTGLSASPKEGEWTKYEVDGENELDDIPKEERKVTLKKSYTVDDDTEENFDLRQKYSMGSLSVQFGVRFNLGQ